MEQIQITDHAYNKAKERLGFNKKATKRIAVKAFVEGFKHKDTNGSVNKYITKLFFKYSHSNNIRIYGDNIYFFCNSRLLTVYRLPKNILSKIKYIETKNK